MASSDPGGHALEAAAALACRAKLTLAGCVDAEQMRDAMLPLVVELRDLLCLLRTPLDEAFDAVRRLGQALAELAEQASYPLLLQCEWIAILRQLPHLTQQDGGSRGCRSAEAYINEVRPLLARASHATSSDTFASGNGCAVALACSLIPQWAAGISHTGAHWPQKLRIISQTLLAVHRSAAAESRLCAVSALNGVLGVGLVWAQALQRRGFTHDTPVLDIGVGLACEHLSSWVEASPFATAVTAESAATAESAVTAASCTSAIESDQPLPHPARMAGTTHELASVLTISSAVGVRALLGLGVMPRVHLVPLCRSVCDLLLLARRGDAVACHAACALLAGLNGSSWTETLQTEPAAAAELVSSLVGCLPSKAAALHGEADAPPELQLCAIALLDSFVSTQLPHAADKIWRTAVGHPAHEIGSCDTPAQLCSADTSLRFVKQACDTYRQAYGLPQL
mmetsp:Transcript_4241/g.9107  ORF Transcript_4241/g.9107 Transcript_4241/m.9107 type:complete len:455 (-) Transcript_4241:642-2006(-)